MIRKSKPTANVTLKRSSGGVFEIRAHGRLVYSKQATGRFPTDAELIASLA